MKTFSQVDVWTFSTGEVGPSRKVRIAPPPSSGGAAILKSPGGSAPTVQIQTPPPPGPTQGLVGAQVIELNGQPTIIQGVTFDQTQDELEFTVTGIPEYVSAADYTFNDSGSTVLTEGANNTFETNVKAGDTVYQNVLDVVYHAPKPAQPAPAATFVPAPPPAPPPPPPPPAAPVVYPTTVTVPVVTTPPVPAKPATPAVPATVPATLAAVPTMAFWAWLLILLVILYLSYKDGYRPRLT